MKLNRDQQLVISNAIAELQQGNRVTISAKKFGHSRKFGNECDIVTNPEPIKKRR